MPTKEFPNHTKFRPGLRRIIAESVAETLSETDDAIAAAWRDVLQSHQQRKQGAAPDVLKRRGTSDEPS